MIKTIKEELKDESFAKMKDAMSNKTTDVVPVELLQIQIKFLSQKIEQLIEEINTIKDALISGYEHD
tara:strand:- start:54 stop:254 length:201 start_codon:yes stop_codon:yes gene_type:complete